MNIIMEAWLVFLQKHSNPIKKHQQKVTSNYRDLIIQATAKVI